MNGGEQVEGPEGTAALRGGSEPQSAGVGLPCRRPGCAGSYRAAGGGTRCTVCGAAPVVTPDGLLGAAPTGLTGPYAPPAPPVQRPSGQVPDHGSVSRPSSRSYASRRSVPGRLPGYAASVPASQRSGRSLPSQLSGRATVRSVSVRSTAFSGGTSGRGGLGAGLVTVPEVPRADPAGVVMSGPEVPERKRFCGNSGCGAPVGRSAGRRPGRTEGYCTSCGHAFSFVPKLRAGDVVHGQYEVAGCLAHGGLGWIYLAVDHAVSGRWVVLKGLLDTGDEEAMQAAISERRFLAQIEHANIVRIYNFVEHPDPRSGSLDGYIVMEYVDGKSLKQIANSRRTPSGRREPLPVDQACAYGLEALEALGHLHGRNLLYCDFKADNAIQQGNRLKLIDMGAVRRMDDHSGALYGTIGYQAPEVTSVGPSVASDLYTVARTLAVLTFDFQGFAGAYADSLPEPHGIEVLERYESFYRLLVRATDPDPARRFASAEEMAEQLLGVLREAVALDSGRPRPALSTLFGPEVRVPGTGLLARVRGDSSLLGARPAVPPLRLPGRRRPADAAPPPPTGAVPAPLPPGLAETALALPVPRVSAADPNAAFLTGLLDSSPAEVLAALRGASVDSVERRLREVRACLELGTDADRAAAGARLEELTAHVPDDWRVVWYRGVAALVAGDRETAALAFDAVYDAFPGEPAPKLALGVCAEVLGQWDNAAEYYRLVWTTDPSYVGAAFGLARVSLLAGDRAGAVRVLESVPGTSVHSTAARVAAVRARLRQRAPQEPLFDDLHAAAEEIAGLQEAGLDAARREELTIEVLGCALDWVLAGRAGAPAAPGPRGRLLGCPVDEEGLRTGLERSYRMLARPAPSGAERTELVERANRIRPKTWM